MLKKWALGALAVLVFGIIAATIYIFSIIEKRPAQTPEVKSTTYVSTYAKAGTTAESWLKTLYEDTDAPSISVAVGVRGQLVWAGVIGHTDLKREAPADLNTLYRIGSISKSLTAATVMRMVEKDQIALDQPFNRYVPDYAKGTATYTIRQLLSHQAGIRHYKGDISESFNDTVYADTRTAAAFVESDPLLFTPGTDYTYSTYGYTVLALAMEKAGGKPFEQLVESDVLKPAGMTATRQDRPGVKSAKPYLLISGALIEAPKDDASLKYAGGGYVSTPSDLVRFGCTLNTAWFLTPDSRKTLWSPALLADGKINPEYYALGFRVGGDTHGAFVHHGGTANGGYSFLLIYPQSDMVVAFASNYTPMDAGFDRLAKAQELAAIFRP